MSLQPHFFESARAKGIPETYPFAGIGEYEDQYSFIVVGRALAFAGTSSAEPSRAWEVPYVHDYESTFGGFAWEVQPETATNAEATRQAISELRRLSGLTWEQLGVLFDVTRRSVHFWASGKGLNSGNEQRLLQVLDVVRAAYRGDARSTRAALFEVKNRTTAFILLTAGKFAEARAVLGVGAGLRKPAIAELSAAAKAHRKPLQPEELIEAQHDRVHRDRGKARVARTMRNNRRGSDRS